MAIRGKEQRYSGRVGKLVQKERNLHKDQRVFRGNRSECGEQNGQKDGKRAEEGERLKEKKEKHDYIKEKEKD